MYQHILQRALKVTHHRHDAEDLTQEVFVCILAGGRSMDLPLGYKILRDLLNLRARRDGVKASKKHEAARPIEVFDTLPDEAVCRAMARLSSDDQDILKASVVDGLSSKQVAKRFGIRHDLARQRKRRALRELKKQYQSLAV